MDAKYEQRKKMIYDFMCDDMYVPMKIKELAIVLGVAWINLSSSLVLTAFTLAISSDTATNSG